MNLIAFYFEVSSSVDERKAKWLTLTLSKLLAL